MATQVPLPDLDRLISVCQKHTLPVELSPPIASVPKLGEAVLGEPFDPQLAAIYQRVGGASFGPISLYRPDLEWNGLVPWNQELREYHSILFDASHVFAKEIGFALYFATVPRLANAHGVQPVIYIQAMDELSAVPVASSVDRFLDSYARYLELMVVDHEYIHSRVPEVVYPWSIPQLIARDEPLLEQLRVGAFDFLMQDDEDAQKWARELLTARP